MVPIAIQAIRQAEHFRGTRLGAQATALALFGIHLDQAAIHPSPRSTTTTWCFYSKFIIDRDNRIFNSEWIVLNCVHALPKSLPIDHSGRRINSVFTLIPGLPLPTWE